VFDIIIVTVDQDRWAEAPVWVPSDARQLIHQLKYGAPVGTELCNRIHWLGHLSIKIHGRYGDR